MAYQVIYAGKPLHDYMDILSIDRTILPSRENSSKSIAGTHGSYYMSYKYGEKHVKLSCAITAQSKEEYVEKLRDLAFLLDVKSPKQLILGDSPDTYLLAVLNGDTDIDKIRFNGQFELDFICHNPYEYSRKLKTTEKSALRLVENPTSSNGGEVWIETVDDEDDENLGDDFGYDEVQDGEGDDNQIDYESEEFEYDFMEDFDEDYEPEEEEGFEEEIVDEEVLTRSIQTSIIDTLSRQRIARDLEDEYEDGDDKTYEISPDLTDTEYNYHEIMKNSTPLQQDENEKVHEEIREIEKEELQKELSSRATLNSVAVEGKQHKLFLTNAGTVPTYPIITADFSGSAHYFQCENHKGQTVLIGTPPSLEKPKATPDTVVLNDTCKSLKNWMVAGDVVDADRVVTGSLGINKNGYAITCANYGSDSEHWHGGAGRRNLTRQVENFRVEIDMEHESGGELSKISNATVTITGGGNNGNTSTTKSSADGWYIVDIKSGTINQRKGRGKSTTLIQKIPKGKKLKISSISKKWGKCTYNKKTGYVYMSYLKKTTAPSTTGSKTSSSSSYYKTNIQINQRTGRGTKYKVKQKIPKGKVLKVTSIKNGWGYCSYKNIKGYVFMKNLTKSKSTKKTREDSYSKTVTREDRMGRIEVYGFDSVGTKLFKAVMRDSSAYYEYSEPEIFIGNSLVMSDGKSTPSPKTKKVVEDKKTTTHKIDSGAYGDWNSFDGKFIIERRTSTDSKTGKKVYTWKCKVEKYKGGKVVKELPLTKFQNSSYPTGNLASIVIWFGQYKNEKVVDTQNVTNIKVIDLKPSSSTPTNKPIFKKGDKLEVNFESQSVRLNGKKFLSQLDIGSEFFDVPAGQSEIICRSDSSKMVANAEYRERWI